MFMLPFHKTTRNADAGFFLEIRDSFLKGMLKSPDRGILLELAIAVVLQTVSWTPLQFNPKHNKEMGIQALFSLFNNFVVKITSAG